MLKEIRQKTISVAIQGGYGSFHEIAACEYFADMPINISPCDTFEDLFHELAEGNVDCAMVAIENSVAGSILPNYAKLRNSGLLVAGEIYLRIVQNLVALPGQSLSDIQEIHSHPVAIQQCNIFLEEMRRKGVKVVESIDTALSAKWIRDESLWGIGAVASKNAAQLYNLDIIAEGVEADKMNFTRFLLVTGNEEILAMKKAEGENVDKALVCFSLPHKVGSLSQILSILSYYDINLTKIQSLPIVGKAWEYLFHIDLLFQDYHQYKLALDAIRPLTAQLEILGEYQHGQMPQPE
ncbi:MAG TPA: prephenate dehydratase domain-containing protein [Bacteroidales bacterium]|nr:prephenate dehydratase domain-containing protein [Bacteroidales bacterium]